MKYLLTKTALVAAISFNANAALITIESGDTAYLSTVESAYLGSLTSFNTETFDGLGGANVDNGSDQGSWENKGASINTSVGTFTLNSAGQSSGNPFNGELMIESSSTGEFGREVLASSSTDFWLDSNDATSVTWDISSDNTYNSLGFYLADPNDQGARLNLSYSDGSSEQINFGFGSGALFYVTILSDLTINGASLDFVNCASSSNCTDLDPNDGWGIDDASVGVFVPEPGSLALFGLGLAGLGMARRKSA